MLSTIKTTETSCGKLFCLKWPQNPFVKSKPVKDTFEPMNKTHKSNSVSGNWLFWYPYNKEKWCKAVKWSANGTETYVYFKAGVPNHWAPAQAQAVHHYPLGWSTVLSSNAPLCLRSMGAFSSTLDVQFAYRLSIRTEGTAIYHISWPLIHLESGELGLSTLTSVPLTLDQHYCVQSW